MVGNDVDEDMLSAEKLGMQGFLLTNCLINRNQQVISRFPRGDFEDLKIFLEEIDYL